jgi:all-trans-retinol 13,14-reductase
MKIVVIGSGVAGLTAGAYMSRDGHDVTIYEQFHEIGGVATTIEKDGYKWDLGPLLLEGLGPDEPTGRVLAELGIADKISLIHEDRGLAFPDFDLWRPEDYQGPYWRRDKLKSLFPSEAEGLDRYYEFYDLVMDLITLNERSEREAGLAKLMTRLKLFRLFRKVRHMEKWSAAEVMDHFFDEEKVKAVFTAILADFVVLPSQFQGLGIPRVNVETAFDKRIPRDYTNAGLRPAYHYIEGGCGTLVDALADFVKSNGGKILTNATIRKINVENGKVKSVVRDDSTLDEADCVIATGGARECFFEMVGREHLTPEYERDVERLSFMESVHMVQLGIDFDPTPYQRAALCYYIGDYDIEHGVKRCKNGDYHEGEDGFLIYIPSMHTPEMAPDGRHAVTIYTIAPNKINQGSWSDVKEEMTDSLLACAEQIIPDLREHATVREILTPEDFQKRTHLKHHSFGGVSAAMGHPGVPYRTPIQNLWFVGAQSESMGGVSNVISTTAKVVKGIRR